MEVRANIGQMTVLVLRIGHVAYCGLRVFVQDSLKARRFAWHPL